MRSAFHTPLLASLLVLSACGSPAPPISTDSADPATGPSAGNPAGTASGTSPRLGQASVAMTVPSGVQCIAATVTGSTTETVSSSVTAGAASVTISLGVLNPGVITVNANAYPTACPAQGAPTWVGDPVQATVVAGVTTQVPIVLHQAPTGSGTVSFSLPAISIAVGPSTSFSVLSDGSVRAWGSNASNIVSPSAGGNALTPTVVPGVTNAMQIAMATNGYACAVRTDSSVVCWGNPNGYGYPMCNMGGSTAPTVVPGLSATQVSASIAEVAFLGAGGNLVTSARNIPCGFSTTSGVPSGLTSIAASWSAGANSVGMECWVTEQGAAQCHSGLDLSSGTYGLAAPAARVYEGTEQVYSAPFACAILVDGTVTCGGTNTYGELGLGTFSATAIAPTVVPGLQGVVSMALSRTYGASAAHACAATQTGQVLCAGNNTYGQLGNDTNKSSATFIPVIGLSNIVEVAAGSTHSCARKGDGSVYCWGTNDNGQLGDGTTTTRFAPVAVGAW